MEGPRSFISVIKNLVRIFNTPVVDESLLKDLPEEIRKRDAASKPVVCYEHLLFIGVFWNIGLTQFVSLWTCWPGMRIFTIILTIIFFTVSLIHVLFPPQFSLMRFLHILLCLIFFVILFSPSPCGQLM